MINEDKFDPSDKIIGECEKHEEFLDSQEEEYDDGFDEGAPYYCEECCEERGEDQVHKNDADEVECDICGGLVIQ